MATTHYNFPTITGTDTIDGVNAINGLANSVDAALYGVANDIPDDYTLPIAGTTSLGGVRGAGQIAVNPTTGDMSINPGTISGNMIQTGTIIGSNIASGTIGMTNFDSSTQSNINQGAQAYSTMQAKGVRTTITSWSDTNGFTSTARNGFYVDYPSAKLLLVKVSLQGSINLAQMSNGAICSAELPSQYSLSYALQSLCGVALNPTDHLPINFDIIYDGNTISMNASNMGSMSGTASGISVIGSLLIPYQTVLS